MLPTDNTKRLLLQQHLLHNRLAQQFGQGIQLQSPTMTVSTTAAGTATAGSPLPSAMRPVPGLSRENGAGFQAPQDSSNVLQMLLFAEQERRLKRRLSEMQQQLHFQQQQQTSQTQHIISSVRAGVATTAGPPKTTNTAAGVGLTNEQIKMLTGTGATTLPSPSIAPITRGMQLVEESLQQQQCTSPFGGDIEGGDSSVGDNTEKAAAATSSGASAAGVSRKDARWKEMYDELIEYKKKHNGSCIVPRGFSENPRLASWVAEQRKQYKLMKDGRQSSITPERVELLNKVDFAWNAQEAAWVKHMTDLKSFRQQHGHCHVPLNDPTFPKLGLWVKEQRRHYTLMKQGKQSHMTEARCAELDSVGFCWDTHEATWLERLNELRTYKAQQGHCIVPTNYPQNPKLGTWIHHQRRQYKKFKDGKPCHITAERIRALDSLGFVWHPRDKNSCISPPAAIKDTIPHAAADLTNLDLRPRKRQRHT